ncbi:hypothetical protein LTR94_014298 [Friedmanniomyces endolithicus]|nr:hypothetical protein LTR94_014298 [Friedmanniomyces endolithicus]
MKAALSAQNADFGQSTGRGRLSALLTRLDRGLLTYEKYGPAELRQLCRRRGFQPTQRARGEAMKASLEQADDELTFPRFMDLPPELRVEIYGYHLHSLDQGTLAVQPPLTTVCKLVRREALPLFYAVHRFGVNGFNDDTGWNNTFILCAVSQAMIQDIGPTNLSQIRKLRLQLTAKTSRGYLSEWIVDLGSKEAPARVWFCRPPPPPGYRSVGEEIGLIAQLAKVLSNMTARPEGDALQSNDVKALIGALDSRTLGT